MLKTLNQMRSDRALQMECFRFCVVGLLCFGIDFCILVLCRDGLHMNCAWAATIGYLVGLIATYTLNVNWVFQTRRLDSRGLEFSLFVGIGLIGLGVTQLLFAVGVGVFCIDYKMVKLISTTWITIQNFVARKYLLFSNCPGKLNPAVKNWDLL